jgi:hypothetical protein
MMARPSRLGTQPASISNRWALREVLLSTCRKAICAEGPTLRQATSSFTQLSENERGDGTRTCDVQLGKTTVNGKQRTLRFLASRSGDRIYRVFTLCSLHAANGAQMEHKKHPTYSKSD